LTASHLFDGIDIRFVHKTQVQMAIIAKCSV